MRRLLGWIAIVFLLLLCAVALGAYGTSVRAQSLDDRARSVEQSMRCPVCQGETVADSPSDIARSMRVDIRARLARGQTPRQIRAYYVSRYGDFIVLAPPDSGFGRFAWLAPPLLILGGTGLLVTLLMEWRTRGKVPVAARRERSLERVRAELAVDLEEPVEGTL
jgi:cytochrome c-type biogenesis protein CcmH